MVDESFDSELNMDARKLSLVNCIICFDKKQDTVIMDCGHAGLCNPCAVDLFERGENCPICR